MINFLQVYAHKLYLFSETLLKKKKQLLFAFIWNDVLTRIQFLTFGLFVQSSLSCFHCFPVFRLTLRNNDFTNKKYDVTLVLIPFLSNCFPSWNVRDIFLLFSTLTIFLLYIHSLNFLLSSSFSLSSSSSSSFSLSS